MGRAYSIVDGGTECVHVVLAMHEMLTVDEKRK